MLPSILSADFGAFRSQVVELLDAGARAFHVDVMDGHFVPVITFGPRVVSSFADLVHERGGTIDVHLMIEQPERQLRRVREGRAPTRAPCTSRPARTCTTRSAQIHELGMTRGRDAQPRDARRGAARGARARPTSCSACPSTPAGAASSFIEASLERLGELTALLRPGMGLEVDGGVGAGDDRALPRGRREPDGGRLGDLRPAVPGRGLAGARALVAGA